jgi:cytochrome b
LSETSNEFSSPTQTEASATVQVWGLPLRVFHWALAALVLTAWFSANVYDTLHEIAGYLTVALIAFRLVWGFIGPSYARFANFVRSPVIVLRHLRDLAHRREKRYLGHNPAGGAMIVALLALLVISTVSGWMQTTVLFFGVEWVEKLHAYTSHLVLILATVHVLGVLFTSLSQRENLVLAMITGRKAIATGHDRRED